MTAPFLLAFALIQAPNAVPQDFQLTTPTAEPVLATGIRVEVVQNAAQEAGEVEDAPLTNAPITTATYVGVVPQIWDECRQHNRPCSFQIKPPGGWGWSPLGWDLESRLMWQTVRTQQFEFLEYNLGYRGGHAAAEAKAARARLAANPPGSSWSSRNGSSRAGASSYSSGSNAGGGRSSGSTWTGTSSGGSDHGKPDVAGQDGVGEPSWCTELDREPKRGPDLSRGPAWHPGEAESGRRMGAGGRRPIPTAGGQPPGARPAWPAR